MSANGLHELLKEFDDHDSGTFNRQDFCKLGSHIERQRRYELIVMQNKKARSAGALWDKLELSDDGVLSLEMFLGIAPNYFAITSSKASRTFDKLDIYGSSLISRDVFEGLNEILGVKEEKNCDNLFTLLDETGIDLVSKCSIMCVGPNYLGISVQEMEDLCKALDFDRNGNIPRKDFTRLQLSVRRIKSGKERSDAAPMTSSPGNTYRDGSEYCDKLPPLISASSLSSPSSSTSSSSSSSSFLLPPLSHQERVERLGAASLEELLVDRFGSQCIYQLLVKVEEQQLAAAARSNTPLRGFTPPPRSRCSSAPPPRTRQQQLSYHLPAATELTEKEMEGEDEAKDENQNANRDEVTAGADPSSSSSSGSSLDGGGFGATNKGSRELRSRAVRTAGSLFDEIDSNHAGSLMKEDLVRAMPAYFRMSYQEAIEVRKPFAPSIGMLCLTMNSTPFFGTVTTGVWPARCRRKWVGLQGGVRGLE